MGDIKGFLKIRRKTSQYRPVCERVKDFCEVCIPSEEGHSKDQASRCMDCGTPFCHWGCPIGNYIPEWNDSVFNGHWQKAVELLEETNNLPEITGRICPAPCEYACVLGINDDPVTIRENEFAIVERGFKDGWIRPRPPKIRTGKKVAVIGSGPAGLASAAQLNKAGHSVTVFERDDKIGGILRYGIPDFKLNKTILDRRVNIWRDEGIVFEVNVFMGRDYPVKRLLTNFDAVCLACGSRQPRDLAIEGRELKGINFAMDYLIQSNKRVAGKSFASGEIVDAKGKNVVVIGGGDTGADCVGTANRQGAACVAQIEIMSKPPLSRTSNYPWPKYPLLFKSSTSHEEGADRKWEISTKKFSGVNGRVKKLSCIRVEAGKEVVGSDFEIDADLVVLALGFLHPEHNELTNGLGLELDQRGNIKTNDNFMTSAAKVFSCGDMRRGQSLIVWAISEGRKAARNIDQFLMGESNLPAI